MSRYSTLLQVSSDACRIAPRLEAEYKRILREADSAQDVGDIQKAVDRKPGIPLRLAEGFRMTGAFALYDDETKTIYLSSAVFSVARDTSAPECPPDAFISTMALMTAGVYVHEASHFVEHRALGGDLVATSEGEYLAYARETRFLAGLKGWPRKRDQQDADLHELLAKQRSNNKLVLGWVAELRGKEPNEKNLKKLSEYAGMLEKNRSLMADIEALLEHENPFQVSLVQMVAAWKKGWVDFLELMSAETGTRPSLTTREKNREAARGYLADSRAGLAEEQPGSLAYQVMERNVKLAQQDLRFWGDEKQVARALEFYKKRFKEVRPPPMRVPAAASSGNR